MQAATYILTKKGWDRLTTNAIAERAGVNIASLYQYFPNKEAIVAELRRRHLARIDSCSMLDQHPETFRETLAASVGNSIQVLRASPELYRVFAEEIPRGRRGALGAGRGSREYDWMQGRKEMFRGIPDLELAEFVARTAASAVLHEAAISRPELLENPLFVEELVTLLERYLVREDGTERRQGGRGEVRKRRRPPQAGPAKSSR
ncbi:MAG: helix-turn-helix domain-containing protein [Cystobacter sp.]